MKYVLHEDHRHDLHKLLLKLSLLAVVLAGLWGIDDWSGPVTFPAYLPLHILLETIAIVIAGLVFAVVWNTPHGKATEGLVLLACGFAGVAMLDFSHMLSSLGMPDYVTPSGPDKSINFWLAARLLAAITLLIVVSTPSNSLLQRLGRYWILGCVMAFTGLTHWLFLYHPELMPATFATGTGLTSFKVGAEYLIVGLHVLAAVILLWQMRAPLPFHATSMLGALVVMAMSELMFAWHANLHDTFQLLGHVYKVIAFLLLYRAVFLDAVKRPFDNLTAVEANLKATLETIPDLIFEMGLDGRYYAYHSPASDLLAAPPSNLIGRTVFEVMPKAAAEQTMRVLQEAVENGHSTGQVIALDLPIGKRWFELSAARKASIDGEAKRLIVLSRDVTRRHQSEEQLKLLAMAVSKLNDIILITEAEPLDQPGPRIVFANEAFERRTGYSCEEVIGQTPRILQGPKTQRDELERIGVALRQWQPVIAELINYTKSGKEFWIELNIVPIADETGWYTHWVAIERDITERVMAKDALRASAQHTQAILDNMADAVITIDTAGIIRSFSKAATTMFGYSPEYIIGQNISTLMPDPDKSQHDGYLRHYNETGQARILGMPREVHGQRQDGSLFPMSLSITKTEHLGEVTYIGLVQDISQRRTDEEEIRRLAYYDALTGLPNRSLLQDHLRHALLVSDRNGLYGAVMFLDLDHFKNINDTLGHAVGDDLLKQVANRLQENLREGDIVARLGGDEFVLVLESLSSQRLEAVSNAEAAANKVLSALAIPYVLDGKPHVITTSIGVVVFLESGKSISDLLKEADAALYQAKDAGRNTYCFFDPEMQAAALAHTQFEEDMQSGLANREFALFYQVQVDAAGKHTGVEALLRWHSPHRGTVSPAVFIPMAEQSGLILPLGQWVLEEACGLLAAWANAPLTADLTIAVNVSAAQFAQSNFVALVDQALQKSGANPTLLKLELTESTLAANVDDIILKMNAIKSRGVSFSLDDFGTGYSSLSYLKRLPLDQLKIDQSFVRDLLTDANDAAIARTIVSLGRSLGLQVIAEGVETKGQRDFLESMGCDAFQGYYFARPLPLDQLHAAWGSDSSPSSPA